MPSRVQVLNFNDMTGGLNLRADPFKLLKNESPDLLNVDLDPRGGVTRRKAVQPFHTNNLSGAPSALWQFATTSGTLQVLASSGANLYYSASGADFVALSETNASGAKPRSITFNNRCYMVNGFENAIRWDGATATRLGTDWNNDRNTPTASGAVGDMPKAECIANHVGLAFVANTVESGIARPNRLRFSFTLGHAEDWHENDYIDIDPGADGDEITALVPFADRLLIFKKRSVYALFGSNPENFEVFPVSREVGTVSQESVVNTDMGVFFFSWPEGVFLYQGDSPKWQFERLYPMMQDGSVPAGQQNKVALGWSGRRLWLSLPYGPGASAPTRCFVLDPSLGEGGAWTAYNLALSCFMEWKPPGAASYFLGGSVSTSRVLRLDQDTLTDNIGNGATHIDGYYTTRWIDLNQPAMLKNFRAPEFVMRGGVNATTPVQVFRDYDNTAVRQEYFLHTTVGRNMVVPSRDISTPPTTTNARVVMRWDTVGRGWGKAWAVSDQNSNVVLPGDSGNRSGSGATVRNDVLRGKATGRARSVRFKFKLPAQDQPWSLDSLAVRYIAIGLKK